MINIDPKLEKYILRHSEPEGWVLAELNRQTHLKIMNPRMLSGHLQGKVLKMISKMIRPEYILEIGTYTGYSAICLAQGLTEKGELHTIEINDELANFARKYFKKANLLDKIKLHIGDALKIASNLKVKFDLVYIDGDKKQYLDYYHTVFDLVNPGNYIIADNVLWGGKVVENPELNDESTKGIIAFNEYVHQDTRVENVIIPIRDGLTVIRKK